MSRSIVTGKWGRASDPADAMRIVTVAVLRR
jgi:hypothetical protein